MTALDIDASSAATDAPRTPGRPEPAAMTPRTWLAVTAVAVGTFAMVTVEQLPMGLLTSIGSGMGVSDGTAGLMVTVPGLVASAAAPLLPVAIGRLDRRTVLLGLLALMVAADVLSVFAPNFPVLLVSRFLVGICIGGFWALAAGIAVRLVPAQHVSRATAITFGGATAANVLGVPAGTLIGEFTDWRAAFATVGALGLLVVGALRVLLPPLPASDPVSLGSLASQFRNPAVRTGILATFLLVGGHFAAFTFVSPILRDVSGVGGRMVGPLLLAFGAAGIGGTFMTAVLAGRNARKAVTTVGLLLAAVLALFPLLGTTQIGGVVLLIGWGLAFGGVPVSVQTWILHSAPGAAEPATALNTAVFNLAIAVGASAGGLIVDTAGLTTALGCGAAVAFLTCLVVRVAGGPARPE